MTKLIEAFFATLKRKGTEDFINCTNIYLNGK
jgi:hypothetical protein